MEPNRSGKLNQSIPDMLKKLDELYEKEEALKLEISKLIAMYNQLQEDKELMQTIIMHQSNKHHRAKPWMNMRR